MTFAIPLVFFLGVIVVMLLRSGDLPGWVCVVVALFGFYLARTHLADPIGAAVTWIVTGLTHSN